MLIVCRRPPRAARAEETELFSDLGGACPRGGQAGIAVGDEVDVEVSGFRVQVDQGVGAGDGVFLARLLLANPRDIKRPGVIGTFWCEQ